MLAKDVEHQQGVNDRGKVSAIEHKTSTMMTMEDEVVPGQRKMKRRQTVTVAKDAEH